jgi:hypothetical protein
VTLTEHLVDVTVHAKPEETALGWVDANNFNRRLCANLFHVHGAIPHRQSRLRLSEWKIVLAADSFGGEVGRTIPSFA